MKKIVIFGDSLLKPIIVNDNKRYVVSDLVDWAEIEETLEVKIENRSRMGATIKHGSEDLVKYLSNNDCYAVIIEYGGNDSDYYWNEVAADKTAVHLPKTAPEIFEETLNGMISLVEEKNIKPILVSLPPISSINYYNWIIKSGINKENIMHHLRDVETIARHQEIYNNIIVKSAFTRKADLVDIRTEFLKRPDYMSLMCEDGIHPNADGQRLIVKSFVDYSKAVSANVCKSEPARANHNSMRAK